MRWGTFFGVVMLALAGCTGPLAARTSAPPASSAEASHPAPNQTPAGPGGARAAPRATGSPADPLARFTEFVLYEAEPGADPTRDLVSDGWIWSATVCTVLGTGRSTDDAAKLLRTAEWSGQAAEAIIRGALEARCPARNTDPPYATAFDRSVRSAAYALTWELPWSGTAPGEYQVGWFAKSSCRYLRQHNGITGFEAHLHSHRAGQPNERARAGELVRAVGADDRRLRAVTGVVVRQVCFDVHHILRYHWQLG